MLLSITNSCKMGCKHCSENATPNGEHMSMEVFKESLKFIGRINPFVVIVTGGEPTDHPHFFEIMRELKKRFKKERLLITSNGLFLEDEEMTEKVLKIGVQIQITNDHRYYPKYVGTLNHPLLAYERNIRTMYPLGRAVANGLEKHGVTVPKCFNLRSICKSGLTTNLVEAIRTLESNGKFCTPSIEIDGSVKTGEFRACNSVGTVRDSQLTIFENIKNLQCNNCGMENELSSIHLSAIKDL